MLAATATASGSLLYIPLQHKAFIGGDGALGYDGAGVTYLSKGPGCYRLQALCAACRPLWRQAACYG